MICPRLGIPYESRPTQVGIRYPIQYHCAENADANTLKDARDTLSTAVEAAIRDVLASEEFKARNTQSPDLLRFVPKKPEDGLGRFRKKGTSIGVQDGIFDRSSQEVVLSDDPVIWFRVMPEFDPRRTWRVTELQKQATQSNNFIHPPLAPWGGYDYVRGADGFGIYPPFHDNPSVAHAVVFAFETGEIWGCDCYLLKAMSGKNRNVIPIDEDKLKASLVEYAMFFERIGVKPPFRWVAGMEDLLGRGIVLPTRPGYTRLHYGPAGKCLKETIVGEGKFLPGDSPGAALKPFFTDLYDACGLERPNWLDDTDAKSV